MYNFIAKTRNRIAKTPGEERFLAMDRYSSHFKGLSGPAQAGHFILLLVGTMGLGVAILLGLLRLV